MSPRIANAQTPLSVVVLISGNGSNLQALIDTIVEHHWPIIIRAVISNQADAYGLKRATAAGLSAQVLSHRDFACRADYDHVLRERIDAHHPELVVLAGFMRIFSDEFVRHYAGRMLNVHPSLLPAYTGLNTHQRVLDAGETQHGVSVHFVTPELDGGPVIAQATVPVQPGDSADDLARRVHLEEHRLYPRVIHWFAEGRLMLDGNVVLLDAKPIDSQTEITENRNPKPQSASNEL